eukprot:ANDGO_08018.mRNA.1 hypothetical protein
MKGAVSRQDLHSSSALTSAAAAAPPPSTTPSSNEPQSIESALESALIAHNARYKWMPQRKRDFAHCAKNLASVSALGTDPIEFPADMPHAFITVPIAAVVARLLRARGIAKLSMESSGDDSRNGIAGPNSAEDESINLNSVEAPRDKACRAFVGTAEDIDKLLDLDRATYGHYWKREHTRGAFRETFGCSYFRRARDRKLLPNTSLATYADCHCRLLRFNISVDGGECTVLVLKGSHNHALEHVHGPEAHCLQHSADGNPHDINHAIPRDPAASATFDDS